MNDIRRQFDIRLVYQPSGQGQLISLEAPISRSELRRVDTQNPQIRRCTEQAGGNDLNFIANNTFSVCEVDVDIYKGVVASARGCQYIVTGSLAEGGQRNWRHVVPGAGRIKTNSVGVIETDLGGKGHRRG